MPVRCALHSVVVGGSHRNLLQAGTLWFPYLEAALVLESEDSTVTLFKILNCSECENGTYKLQTYWSTLYLQGIHSRTPPPHGYANLWICKFTATSCLVVKMEMAFCGLGKAF